jgi:hypothetical protein
MEEWSTYYWDTIEPIGSSTPIALVRGNHDGESGMAYAYTALIDNVDYYASSYGTRNHTRVQQQITNHNDCVLSVGRARLIFLNSNAHPIIAPRQTEWLKQELQSDASSTAEFRYETTLVDCCCCCHPMATSSTPTISNDV